MRPSIAAASTGDDDPVLDEPVPTTLVTTTTTTLESDAPVEDPEAPDEESGDDESDGVERYWGPECGDGAPTNHGQYVRSTEKDGASRSAAAHSPCGKPLHSVDVTTTTAPAPDEEEAVPDGGDETITFELHGAPGSRAALLRSFALAPTPIDVPGVGTLHLDPATLSSASIGLVPPSGVASYTTTVDSDPGMIGRTFYYQGLTSSPRTLTRDFVQLTILP